MKIKVILPFAIIPISPGVFAAFLTRQKGLFLYVSVIVEVEDLKHRKTEVKPIIL